MFSSKANLRWWLFQHAHWNNSQSTDIHVAPLWFIILIPIQPVFALTPYCCVLSAEAANTNLTVYGLTRRGLPLTVYSTRGEHSNHYIPDDAYIQSKPVQGVRAKTGWMGIRIMNQSGATCISVDWLLFQWACWSSTMWTSSSSHQNVICLTVTITSWNNHHRKLALLENIAIFFSCGISYSVIF
jgi:hypothetical protein